MNTPGPFGATQTAPLANPPIHAREQIERGVGAYPERIATVDPGFLPPSDPLTSIKEVRQRAGLVYRDVPNVTIQNNWTVADIRGSLSQHMYGIFEQSSQLWDSMLGDDRVQATLGSRVGGLFGREIRYAAPKKVAGSRAYQECEDSWRETAEELITGWALTESHVYGIGLGFAHGQLAWNTSDTIWRPYARPWHPRFEWYDYATRHFVAISQDGTLPIIVGDGKWYGHLPFGSYRSWIRGALRAVSEPWAIRHFAIRDWAGFSEIHGGPQRIGKVPAAADPGERAQFERAIATIGHNAAMILPQGVDKDTGYGYELVEAGDTAWEAFPGLRDHCDLAIVLAIKFQNLTTEIKSGGSYAAAKEHGKGDVAQIAADNRAWKTTLRRDFARPFAYLNFGDADLAPITDLDVPEPPREDYAQNATAFQQFAASVASLAQAGITFDDPEKLSRFAQSQFGVRMTETTYSIGKPPADKTADAAHITATAAKTTAEKPEPARQSTPRSPGDHEPRPPGAIAAIATAGDLFAYSEDQTRAPNGEFGEGRSGGKDKGAKGDKPKAAEVKPDLHRSATREQWSARPNRESLSKRLGKTAVQIRERDGHKCQYCGKKEPTVPPARPVDKHQLDHITPRVLGGADTAKNLVVACKQCNSARHTMTLRQWSAYAKERYGIKFSPAKIVAQTEKPLPEIKKKVA